MVTVERDVYFNKKAALNPDNAQIEGEWWFDSPGPNLAISSNSSPDAPGTPQTIPNHNPINDKPTPLENKPKNVKNDEVLAEKDP
ncbi:hypothetical protein C0991_004081, partial [Blastosporella zonata]